MLLTITTTHRPATDLGFLLHKHPARVQSFPLAYGQAHVFYPEATEARCTAALVLDIDPIALTRRRGRGSAPPLEPYVNDRPYAASSFLSVAIGEVYSSALAGRCKDRPELAETPIPLEARLAALPCRGGEAVLRRLFEPLGYQVESEPQPLDEQFAEWGASDYFRVTLRADCTVSALLTHLAVLVPVLDDAKHYWVGTDEVEKLLRRGGDWLRQHPEREFIARRYLRHQHHLTRQALSQLLADDLVDPDAAEARSAHDEDGLERGLGLNELRLTAVAEAIRSAGARRVLDLGCGSGRLISHLLANPSVTEIVGVDVSLRQLRAAAARLHLDRLPELQRQRVRLLQGALTYRDDRLRGYDAAALVEVIEHIDPERLPALERVVFEHARPGLVVVTTPNAEYNPNFASLPAGAFRHADHRFEWTRAECAAWADAAAERFRYTVRYHSIGPADPARGAPTQMAVFTRAD